MYYDPSGFMALCTPDKTHSQNTTEQPIQWDGTKVGPDGRVYLTDAGAFGEHIAREILKDNGWSDFVFIKNASDNGIDIIATSADGRLGFFEVKSSEIGDIKNLTSRQMNMY